MGYPPTHRSVNDPQPEICDVCGTKVSALQMQEVQWGKFAGLMVCDTTSDCRDRLRRPMPRDLAKIERSIVDVWASGRRLPGGAPTQFSTTLPSLHPALYYLCDEDGELILDEDGYPISDEDAP